MLPRDYSIAQPSRGAWIAFKDTFGLKWLSNERVIYNLGLSYPLGPGPSTGPFPHTNTQQRNRHVLGGQGTWFHHHRLCPQE